MLSDDLYTNTGYLPSFNQQVETSHVPNIIQLPWPKQGSQKLDPIKNKRFSAFRIR